MRSMIFLLAVLASSGAAAAVAEGEAPITGQGLDRLAAAAGIEVVGRTADLRVETPFGPITARPSGDATARFAALFAEEFAVYPPALVRRSRLKRVVLGSGLAFDGQLRGAIPDFWHDALYLDVARGDYSPTYQRTAIHHEFFHLVDYRDDGEVYRDDAWAALNPPGFRYGPGGKDVQGDALGSLFTDKHPGFLTTYATAGVEEDKAEVFARLLVAPREVARRAGLDPILARKVARMKARLKEFEPAVDDAFWSRVEARPTRPDGPPARPPGRDASR
ncbi:hypothetical protein [Paludisphaera mucosa]|uniref:Uncharacterized protein n=1 Tax=Paludisphaera mucosa TaxID=3030827 RepID=A0ABT6FHF1_9BACT|nr:hypothetical protein [Paludisphaera mucosa]MDG3007021.1 hypothetical protein [Paludisphaera mucosa]